MYVCVCMYVCMCRFCFWPLGSRFSTSIKKYCLIQFLYTNSLYVPVLSHNIGGQWIAFAHDSGNKFIELSDDRKFLLTGLFPTFFVREQPFHHVHMHDMLYQ